MAEKDSYDADCIAMSIAPRGLVCIPDPDGDTWSHVGTLDGYADKCTEWLKTLQNSGVDGAKTLYGCEVSNTGVR